MTIRHRMGLRWASWQLRRRDLYTVDIREALTAGGHAIVFLPDDDQERTAALGACEPLGAWFSPIHLVVLARGESAPELPRSSFSTLSVPRAVNRWGLPPALVNRRMAQFKPATVINLHPSFDLASAYAGVQSGASLRVGFSAPVDGFFNLRFAWSSLPGVGLAEHYRAFVATLADLRHPTAD